MTSYILQRAAAAARDTTPRPSPKLKSNRYGWKKRNNMRSMPHMKMLRVGR